MSVAARQMSRTNSAVMPAGAVDALFMFRCSVIIVWVHLSDAVTTTLGLGTGLTERNPITTFVLGHGGIGGFLLLKMLIAAGTVLILSRQPRGAMVAIIAATLLLVGTAVTSNALQLLRV